MRLDQRLRIQESDVGGAVAHHDLGVVVRQAPAFARIAELALGVEAVQVQHVADLALPRQADQAALPRRDALAEHVGRQRGALHHLPRLGLDLAHRRMAFQPGALVEIAVQIEQAFGEGVDVVRPGMHDLDAIHRDRLFIRAGGRRVRDGRQRGACREREAREQGRNLHSSVVQELVHGAAGAG